jgi:hypothetical protein
MSAYLVVHSEPEAVSAASPTEVVDTSVLGHRTALGKGGFIIIQRER